MKTINQKNLERARTAILNKLFSGKINQTKIWNGFIAIIGGKSHEHLSVERLEAVADRKFKLKQLISEHFPTADDKLHLISHCDFDLLREITQSTWDFSPTHLAHAKDAIVLHGYTMEEILLDWAAQSVVTMLLGHIKVKL